MSLRINFVCALAFAALGVAQAQTGGQPGTQPAGTQPSQATPAPFTEETKAKILDGIKQILQERAFVPGLDFKRWDEMVEKGKAEIDAAKTETDFVRVVNRQLREFRISHVSLRTPRAAETRRTGTTVGFGLSARVNGTVMVVEIVAPGSPADQAGLKVGDKITMIAGNPINADSRMPSGQQEVVLRVLGTDNTERDVTLKAAAFVNTRADSLRWIDEETAILRINTFARGYEREGLEKFVEEARKSKRLIIDLRNNGGGAVNNLAHLLGLFIPETEAVGTFVNRRIVDEYTKEFPEKPVELKDIASWTTRKFRPTAPKIQRYTGQVAVLINRGSASASEIFAAAMKEVGGGTIVGQNTMGAVLASVYGRLEGGFEIQYPVSDYVTVKGQRLEGDPVKPHVEATGRVENGVDPVVNAAIAAMNDARFIPPRVGQMLP